MDKDGKARLKLDVQQAGTNVGRYIYLDFEGGAPLRWTLELRPLHRGQRIVLAISINAAAESQPWTDGADSRSPRNTSGQILVSSPS